MAAFVRAARPLAFGNLAPGLLFGQALAHATTGRFEPSMLGAALGLGALLQAVILWTNDAADAEADAVNTTYNLFSGGSRVVPDGALTAGALGRAAAVAAVALAAASLALALAAGRWSTFALCLAAIGLAWAYSVPPAALARRGLGAVAQGVGVGVVLPALGFSLQAPDLGALPTAALVPSFVLAFTGNVITALPDTPADRATGKRTWPVERGERRARGDVLVLGAAALAAVPVVGPPLPAGWLAAVLIPPAALLGLALPLAPRADAVARAACLRFVVLTGASGALALSTWALALFVAG